MTESDEQQIHPKDLLLSILTSDFGPEGYKSRDEKVSNPVILSLDIKSGKLSSSEDQETAVNREIGRQVGLLLEPSAVSDAFKEHLQTRIQKAHAEKVPVFLYLTPNDLGLDQEGFGIYNSQSAQSLEDRYLRKYIFESNKNYLDAIHANKSGRLTGEIMAGMGLQLAMARWADSYKERYDEDPFGDPELSSRMIVEEAGYKDFEYMDPYHEAWMLLLYVKSTIEGVEGWREVFRTRSNRSTDN